MNPITNISMNFKKVKILGVNIFADSKDTFINYFLKLLNGNFTDKKDIFTPNVDFLVNAVKDKEFKEILNSSYINLPDGKPLVWASYLYDKKIKQKISGSSIFFELMQKGHLKNRSVFLLGGTNQEILNKSIKNIRGYGIKRVAGYCPVFGFEKNEIINERIITLINRFSPEVIVIGLGSPKQEKYIYHIKNKINYKVSFCLGATIDFISGAKSPPPDFLKVIGFAWIWRLIQEPSRLWRRYLLHDMKIFFYILQEKLRLKDFS